MFYINDKSMWGIYSDVRQTETMYISCKINHKFGTNIRYKNSGNLISQPPPQSIKLPIRL